MVTRLLFLGLVLLTTELEGTGIINKFGLPIAKREFVTWSAADFEFPDLATRSNAIQTGRFVKENVIATRFQVRLTALSFLYGKFNIIECHQFWKDTLLVVFPRYKNGIPATIATTDLSLKRQPPVWKPFPSWSMQNDSISNCNQIIHNAVDVYIDYKV
jgi:hypothetical protein